MNPKFKETIIYYNSIAEGYKNLYGEEQEIKITTLFNTLKELKIKKESKNLLCLDLGAGIGLLNKYFKIHFTNSILISIDSSEKLLRKNPNLYNIIADITHLPFHKETFHILFSFSVFQDLYHIKQAIKESYRILKKNGLFILTFIKISSKKKEIFYHIKKKFIILKEFYDEKEYYLILKKIK